MKACPSCGAACQVDARFCLECGEPLADAESLTTSDPWLGRMVAGRFRLLSKLGDGGMGEVYRAEQMPMGRHIALKILRQALSDDPKQVERFKREAQAASALSHPNTIIVHDFGQDTDGTLFIAMELLEGEPLSEVLSREGALPPERAAAILRQICGSLDEAHSHGLVHRDLKPENVFLTERAGANDFVKVLDFGIAKVTESGGQKLETITQAGAIFGTPQYMAPEQIRGEGVDARADIYALGVILYEMISGHLPFAAGSVVEMLTKHLTAPPAPIVRKAEVKADANVPRLEAIALRALSKDPTRRQQSARAFLEDIMAAMPQLALTTSTGMVAATPAGVADLNDASSGSAGKVVLIAAILAAIGAGGLFLMAQNGGGGAPIDAAPAALLQPVGDNGGGGGPASDAPASEAPASEAPASAASAAPATTGEPTDAEKAEAAAAEKAAEEQAKKDEAEAAKAAAEANKPMSDAEAQSIAAAAEAEAKQAAAEEKKAAAEKKAKAQAEKAKKAEAAKAAAIAAKATADAEKKAALQQASDAKAATAAAKAQAEEAKAQAAEAKAAAEAAAAKNEADKKAALEAQKKAAADLAKIKADAAKIKAEADKVKAAAAQQAAEAARLKAESDAVKAQLAQIEEEKAAAAAAEAEAKAKREEAKRKAAAARKKKRASSAFGKVYIRTRSLGASITVDGKPRGRSPLRKGLSLRPGKHTVTAVTRKGKRKTQTFTVKPGKVLRLKVGI